MSTPKPTVDASKLPDTAPAALESQASVGDLPAKKKRSDTNPAGASPTRRGVAGGVAKVTPVIVPSNTTAAPTTTIVPQQKHQLLNRGSRVPSRVIVLDTETTGRFHATDSMLEICALGSHR